MVYLRVMYPLEITKPANGVDKMNPSAATVDMIVPCEIVSPWTYIAILFVHALPKPTANPPIIHVIMAPIENLEFIKSFTVILRFF